RLAAATQWAESDPQTRELPVGYFGSSTGAAAALIAAALPDSRVGAIVSRGGRPDLAGAMADVRAPTLLIVGGLDTGAVELNRSALTRLAGEKELVIVPGAGHLFEEPGALDQVVSHAQRWFATHLAEPSPGMLN